MFTGDEVLSRPKKLISVGPALDIALGGGIPEGTTLVISGKPKIGKTTTILSFAAQAQKLGKRVWYLDVEHRLKKKNLHGVKGLNLDPNYLQVIQSSAENILHGESWLAAAEQILRDDPNCVLIFDSASALCSQTEYVEEISGQRRSLGPKLMSAFCKRNSATVGVNRSNLVIIQHLIANTSGKGRAYVEDGGEYIKYQMDSKIRAIGGEEWKVKDKNVGLTTTWLVEESANESTPNVKVESWIRFGVGVDRVFEVLQSAINFAIINTNGAWHSMEINGETKKWNGVEQLYQYFIANPEHFAIVDKAVMGLLYHDISRS